MAEAMTTPPARWWAGSATGSAPPQQQGDGDRATTPASWVRAPAASATGVRDALLLIGKPWKNPAARLAAPSPSSPGWGRHRCGSASHRHGRARWCRRTRRGTAQHQAGRERGRRRRSTGWRNAAGPAGARRALPRRRARPGSSRPTTTIAASTAIRMVGRRLTPLSSRITPGRRHRS